MSQKLLPLLLGAVLVSMATAAPLANQEQAVAADQGDNTKDRAKRADEQIVFGNQQNKPNFVNKRGDLYDLSLIPDQPAHSPALGELDKGSEVEVHKALPIENDLAERADAARKDFQDEDKIADAMEAAMESVDKEEESEKSDDGAVAETDQTASNAAEGGDDTDEEPPAATEDEMTLGSDEGESGAGESNADENVDEDIKDLLQVTSSGAEDEEAVEQETPDTTGYLAAGQLDSLAATDDQSAQAFQNGDEQGATNVASVDMPPIPEDSGRNNQELREFLRQMYQYMAAYPGNARLLYDVSRRRRSLVRGKQSGARRIKRDLLDDVEYDPVLSQYVYGGVGDGGIDTASSSSSSQYTEPSSVMDMGDALLSDPDDYVPLTEADAEDLYNELEDYLRWELQRREGADRLREVLGLEPREDVSGDTDEGLADFYRDAAATTATDPEDARSFLLELQSRTNPQNYPSDDPYYYATKRGAYLEEPDKRYFFPFADEPETHWGAFVPEKRDMLEPSNERDTYLDDAFLDDYRGPSKRDYNEAIQRLQRLAMALSDNQDSYYNEEQPYKK